MNDIVIPAQGCLVAGWTTVSGKKYIERHWPVFGLVNMVPVIAFHGYPATSDNLDQWLISSSDKGEIYATNYGEFLWQWIPECVCRGEKKFSEDASARDISDARDAWLEWKETWYTDT